ncbi:MAG: hypothetical protein GY842_13085 [bacterium]|nr:hypothetical protein [bacterium]
MKATSDIVSVELTEEILPYGRAITNTEHYLDEDQIGILVGPREEVPEGAPAPFDRIPWARVKIANYIATPVTPTKPKAKRRGRG